MFPKEFCGGVNFIVVSKINVDEYRLLPSNITVFTLDFSGNLRWNKLQDVIPPKIGELKSLTHLYLSFNNFKGEIPKELANLPLLRYLYLHENRFIGRIPPELGTLQQLGHLYLDHNQFTGRIPDAFYKHTFLKEMYIEGNAFRPGVNPIGVHNVLEVSDTEFLF
ncbi:hypothetical protein CsSME_00016697 [Camellia sinensis var. sinensis]